MTDIVSRYSSPVTRNPYLLNITDLIERLGDPASLLAPGKWLWVHAGEVAMRLDGACRRGQAMRLQCVYAKVKALVLAGLGLLGVAVAGGAEARIIGINHTHWAINRFSVDGHSGLDIIGPWQGGGGGHYRPPAKWVPGMTVRVDWETGIAYPDGFPGFHNSIAYDAWAANIRAQNRQYSKQVLVPEYRYEEVCGITVHFLPCEEIQVTTSCYGYGHPEYPIKTPLNLPEPQSCPK